MKQNRVSHQDLVKNNIEIEYPPVPLDYVPQLPNHAEALRQVLLDFTYTTPDRLQLSSDDTSAAIRSKLLEAELSFGQLMELDQNLTLCEEIAQKARANLERGEREAAWQTFFDTEFFSPLYKKYHVQDTDSRSTSRSKFYYEYYECKHQRHWMLFEKDNGIRDHPGLTKPIPDWSCYFPVYDVESTSGASRRWRWNQSLQNSLVGNFSRLILQELALSGLHSNPTGAFQTQRTSVKGSDLLCFPWFVVEHKKDDQAKRACYHQAANDGSAMLVMLQSAARYAEDKTDHKHVPPAVTMTTAGPSVVVWLHYVTSKGSRVVPIWEASMTNTVDVMLLQVILENLHSWAMQVLRPQLSAYIDQWKYRHLRAHTASESEHDVDMLESLGDGEPDPISTLRATTSHVTQPTVPEREPWFTPNYPLRSTPAIQIEDFPHSSVEIGELEQMRPPALLRRRSLSTSSKPRDATPIQPHRQPTPEKGKGRVMVSPWSSDRLSRLNCTSLMVSESLLSQTKPEELSATVQSTRDVGRYYLRSRSAEPPTSRY